MRYKHDCDHCKPLGTFAEYDLYYCDELDATVLARYGDEGHQYFSGLNTGRPELKIAQLMAEELGFINVRG